MTSLRTIFLIQITVTKHYFLELFDIPLIVDIEDQPEWCKSVTTSWPF